MRDARPTRRSARRVANLTAWDVFSLLFDEASTIGEIFEEEAADQKLDPRRSSNRCGRFLQSLTDGWDRGISG